MSFNCKLKIEECNNKQTKSQKIRILADHLIDVYNSDTITAKQSIEELRSQTVNTKEAVDNIKAILKNSGFDGFEIVEKESVNNISQYYLKRPNSISDNPVFKSLSEGEKNFISFLYFYQLCLGTDDIQNNSSRKKIIVIDDPVSSLDSQSMFIVSSLIHNLIWQKGNDTKLDRQMFRNENIIQIFLLTHNLYFYKEVSFNRRLICTDYWHYKITKIHNKSVIKGECNKTIFDDYTLLWKTIKELKVNMPINNSLNIVIANSMRRIIHSYVNFIGLGKDSWAALQSLNKEEPTYYIKCAFISMINEESHRVSVMDEIYYQRIINEHPKILFDIFKEIFEKIGKEHYDMMLEEKESEV